ncbi:MAG: hypothetical protein K9L70_07945 [Thiohalocapsa sp.]|nr:hypothetical protein [Thiohalocapsa sp.]MCF7991575.1 hypothetical protein [Thiohalocapsa sp.]
MTLDRLRAAAGELADIDPDLARWLADAARGITHGLPADAALGISGPGALRQRDKYILQAALALDMPAASLWRRAQVLADRAARLHRRRHPAEGQAALVDELLAEAERCAKLPGARQIFNILRDRWTTHASEIKADEISRNAA